MKTLYSQAESNIRKTFLLIFVFLVLIILIGWILSYVFDNSGILIFAVIFSVLTSFFSYWYSDKVVLSLTNSKPIEKKDNPELYRLVENLCITSGLPLPKIYVLGESQPNAFATGRNEKKAVIALSSGLLQKLDRAELEGVVAHELSHIKNKDMLIQTIAVTLTGVIALVSHFFLRFGMFGGFSKRRQSKGNALIMVLGLVAVILAPIAASLLKLAVSRKREFLADASGALLTRYPDGLIRALEKISSDETPLKKANNSTAHLFICSPFKGEQKKSWFTKLFLTHPPTKERIKALKGLKI